MQSMTTRLVLSTLLFTLDFALPLLGSSQDSAKVKSTLYHERYRPAFHFTPEAGWLNDPNGMVYYQGVYHLYYQHVPAELYGQKGGGKHWGHATSKDLIHWKHEPIAVGLHPIYGGAPSGNTAIDWENRSGLKNGAHKVFCCYFAQRNRETQQNLLVMAYSTNGGMSFDRFEKPVHITTEGEKCYDPDVFWYEKEKKWILVASQHFSKFVFFESTNLKDWKEFYILDLGADYHEMWDCVDFYPLQSAETPSVTKWVLSFSLFTKTEGRVAGQAYFVGDFDGKKFTPDTKRYQFFDQGPDLHAGVTWSEIPNNERRIFIAWFGNWRSSGQKIPTKPWCGALTLPREVTLHQTRNGYRLHSQPVKESNSLRAGKVESTTSLPAQYELEYTINGKQDSKTIISNASGEQITFGYIAADHTFYFDRSQAGAFDRRVNFPRRHSFKIESRQERLKVRVLVDNSVAELFINDGEYTMSEQFFPEQPFQILKIEPAANDLQIWRLESIWAR
jgi:fructan beta-fructosidase